MCCSGDKILNFKSLKIILYSVVGVYIGLLISGCVSVVPGTEYGGSYCFSTNYSQKYSETVASSEYSYGQYNRDSVTGNRDHCGLKEFHILYVSWRTKSGTKLNEIIDVPALMKNLQSEYRIPPSSRSPHLILKVVGSSLELIYETYNPLPGIEQDEWKKRFPIYHIEK